MKIFEGRSVIRSARAVKSQAFLIGVLHKLRKAVFSAYDCPSLRIEDSLQETSLLLLSYKDTLKNHPEASVTVCRRIVPVEHWFRIAISQPNQEDAIMVDKLQMSSTLISYRKLTRISILLMI